LWITFVLVRRLCNLCPIMQLIMRLSYNSQLHILSSHSNPRLLWADWSTLFPPERERPRSCHAYDSPTLTPQPFSTALSCHPNATQQHSTHNTPGSTVQVEHYKISPLPYVITAYGAGLSGVASQCKVRLCNGQAILPPNWLLGCVGIKLTIPA